MATVSFEDLLEHTGTIKAKSDTLKNNRGNKKSSDKLELKLKKERLSQEQCMEKVMILY